MSSDPYFYFDLMLGLMFYATFCVMMYALLYFPYCLLFLFPSMRRSRSFPHPGRAALFLAISLVVGEIFNLLWGITIHGWFYDSIDYVGADFLPFMPVTPAWLDDFGLHAQFYCITPGQLQYIWAVFAACTWGATILLYKALPLRYAKTRQCGRRI